MRSISGLPTTQRQCCGRTLSAQALPQLHSPLTQEALAAGTMEGYFPLAEHFLTQALPSFCGLASLAMVLNALQVDPKRVWQGSWRRAARCALGRGRNHLAWQRRRQRRLCFHTEGASETLAPLPQVVR